MPQILNKTVNAREVHRLITKGSAIYVGRPSKYGNPFIIGRDGNREEVIRKYKDYIYNKPGLLEQAKQELVGKDLVCWCAPLQCHAEVLLEIANNI